MQSKLAVFTAIVAGCLAAQSAGAATSIYLKFTDPNFTITGSSLEKGHANEIDLKSYTQSITGATATDPSTGSGAATRPTCGPVTVTKLVDAASPRLVLGVFTERLIQQALISFVDSSNGRAPATDYTITFTNIVLTSIKQSDTTPAEPTESVTFSFEKMAMQYTPQTPSGTGGTPVTFTVNCEHLTVD